MARDVPPFFQEYLKASQSFNVVARSAALINLLKLPQRALIRSRGGHGKALRNLASQMSHVLSPEPSLDLPSKPVLPTDPLLPKVLRASELVAQGHIGKIDRLGKEEERGRKFWMCCRLRQTSDTPPR